MKVVLSPEAEKAYKPLNKFAITFNLERSIIRKPKKFILIFRSFPIFMCQ